MIVVNRASIVSVTGLIVVQIIVPMCRHADAAKTEIVGINVGYHGLGHFAASTSRARGFDKGELIHGYEAADFERSEERSDGG